jgi:hypothetical protein
MLHQPKSGITALSSMLINMATKCKIVVQVNKENLRQYSPEDEIVIVQVISSTNKSRIA